MILRTHFADKPFSDEFGIIEKRNNIFRCHSHCRRRPPSLLKVPTRELKQPRPLRRQEPQSQFAYLAAKNSSFARFARAVFSFAHFAAVLVLSTT